MGRNEEYGWEGAGGSTGHCRPLTNESRTFPKKNVGLFSKNVGDFLKNVGLFPKNVGDFLNYLRRFCKLLGHFMQDL